MARAGQRAAAAKGHASLNQLQQLQLQFSPSGELKAVTPAKTFRVSDCAGNWDDYARGSILRMRLINFQKYSDCLIRPGPFMNMIIGPNGTGKSTIVAAIALGLGANPGVLGRSKNVAEFIKYNASSASIEIILKSDGKSDRSASTSGYDNYQFITIKRVLRRTTEHECESDWFINGNISTQRAVVQCAQEMGVQISNLCQFLPQDKVSDFALMTPEQMLVATMSAAAPEETLNQFNELVQLKKEERTLSATLKKDQTELLNNQRVLSTLQTLKQRARERDERKKKLELLKRKRPWLLYNKARNYFTELKAKRDALKEKLDAAIAETDQELVEEIKDIEGRLRQSSRKLKQLTNRVLSARSKAFEMNQKVATVGVEIAQKKESILEIRQKVADRRESYENTRQELKEIDEKMGEMQRAIGVGEDARNSIETRYAEVNDRINPLELQLARADAEEARIKEESEKLVKTENAISVQLTEMRSVRSRRLEILSKLNENIPAAMNWLEHNKHVFRGEISPPICLDLEIRDEKLAGALESVVSRSILFSFVCENLEDHKRFSEVCEANKWIVNSVLLQNYQSDPAALPASPWSREDLRSMGFDGVLSNVIAGPMIAIWALHELTKIHMIPFSKSDLSRVDIKRCESTRNLVKFLISDSFFEIRRSRYDERDVAIKSSPLKPTLFFAVKNSSESEIQTLQAKYEAVRAKSEIQMKSSIEVMQKKDAIRIELDKWKDKLKEILNLKNEQVKKKADLAKLQLKRESLKRTVRDLLSFINQNCDESEELEGLKGLIDSRKRLVFELRAALCKYHETTKVAGSEVIYTEVNEAKLNWLKYLLEQRQGEHENLKSQLELTEVAVSAAREKAHEALKVAEMDEEMDEETRVALEGLTEDLGELDQQILAEETLLSIAGSGDRFGQQDLDELERRTCSVQELEEKIASNQKSIDALKQKMTEITVPWRRQVDQMIEVISAKFSDFFSKISCTGKVSLGLPQSQDESDFDAYSLVIWVKFRATELLQRLTGQRQSGGEKSVSTILFLLSLQELSRAPFRVVDEINQGMDVENERKIHSIIVETATNSNANNTNSTPSTQYFLITPKLLTGLDYHEKMHILCIFNGPGVLKDE